MRIPIGLICVAYFVAITPSAASAGFVRASINAIGEDVQDTPIPGIAEFSNTTTGGLGDVNMGSAQASVLALHALSSRNGIPASPAGAGFGPVVNASFQSEQDIIFDYAANFSGPQEDWVSVTLTAALGGSFTLMNAGGVGGASAEIFAQGNVYSAPNFAAFLPGGTANGVSTSSNLGLSASEVVSITFWVPRGSAVSTFANLQVTSFTNPGGSVISDFSGSFRFNPNEFFTINTPGITANSASLGLVNNQLPAFLTNGVPEPSALALFACGAACLGGLGWRRRRRLRTSSAA